MKAKLNKLRSFFVKIFTRKPKEREVIKVIETRYKTSYEAIDLIEVFKNATPEELEYISERLRLHEMK